MNKDSSSFRAAVVQTLAELGDLDANIALTQTHVEEAVRQGARLIVLPECMNSGYLFDSEAHCREIAEPVTGRYVQALAELCREHNIFIGTGFTEWDEDKGKVFNSALLIDPRGDLILHYHKQFLATHDQNWFEFGERGCPVVDTELGRIGLLICFDGRIPEIARSLALQGAEVILDMANFFAMDQADLWVPARAYENGVWIVAATKSGVERSIYYPGGSMIVSPDGETKAYVPYDTHGVASAEIVPAQARDKSWFYGADRWADRRPATYGLLGEPFEETPLASLLDQPLLPEQATAKGAAVQAHATSNTGSLDEALDMLDHAAKLGSKLLVLPQHMTFSSWLPSRSEVEQNQDASDHATQRVQTICKRYGCTVVLPLFMEHAGQFVPVAVVIGPGGNELGRQQQIHLEPEMVSWAKGGECFSVIDTPSGRLGVLLGYDGMFPESSRVLALAGVDIIAWCCAWRHPNDRKLLAMPKAEDNRCFLICANRSDAPYPGGSFIAPPTGFPQWDMDLAAPPVLRHNAVQPGFMNLALARQKSMIPSVDMIRNRITDTYDVLIADNSIG